MTGYGGQERSEREMFTLLHPAGLCPVRIAGQARTLSVVEVRAARLHARGEAATSAT
jgi:hypothetical protein